MSKPQQSKTIQGRLKEDIDSTIDALRRASAGEIPKQGKKEAPVKNRKIQSITSSMNTIVIEKNVDSSGEQ